MGPVKAKKNREDPGQRKRTQAMHVFHQFHMYLVNVNLGDNLLAVIMSTVLADSM